MQNPAQAGSAWTVRPLVNGVAGFALPGGAVSAIDGTNKNWKLTFFPLTLGSSLSYRVTLTNILPAGSGNTKLTTGPAWDFSTVAHAGIAPGVLDGLTATVGDSGVNLSWSEPTDFDRAGVMIFRKTGAAVPTTADTLVGSFPEGVTSAVDTAVAAGATYTYAAFPYDHDAPPNLGPSVVSAPVRIPTPPDPAPPAVAVSTPAPAPVATSGTTPVTAAKAPVVVGRLLLPTTATLVKGKAQRLRWRKNAKADYYNVQLFMGNRKLISTFPSSTSLLVSAKDLTTPGTYRLLVWSGLGARALGRYERNPWVTKTLVVRAPKKAPAKKA